MVYFGRYPPHMHRGLNGVGGWYCDRNAGNGREVTRVQSQGKVTLQLTTVMKDFTRFGFRVAQKKHGGDGD